MKIHNGNGLNIKTIQQISFNLFNNKTYSVAKVETAGETYGGGCPPVLSYLEVDYIL